MLILHVYWNNIHVSFKHNAVHCNHFLRFKYWHHLPSNINNWTLLPLYSKVMDELKLPLENRQISLLPKFIEIFHVMMIQLLNLMTSRFYRLYILCINMDIFFNSKCNIFLNYTSSLCIIKNFKKIQHNLFDFIFSVGSKSVSLTKEPIRSKITIQAPTALPVTEPNNGSRHIQPRWLPCMLFRTYKF